MLITLVILIVGFIVGFVLRNKVIAVNKFTKHLSFVVTVLVFVMGLSLGSDKSLITNIIEIGWMAFAFGIASVAGSIIFVELLNLILDFTK